MGVRLVFRMLLCMVDVCGSAHAMHTIIGYASMACASCISMLLGSGGFWSVDSCVCLWFRFVVFSDVCGAAAGVVFFDYRVVRSWIGVISWVGACAVCYL